MMAADAIVLNYDIVIALPPDPRSQSAQIVRDVSIACDELESGIRIVVIVKLRDLVIVRSFFRIFPN